MCTQYSITMKLNVVNVGAIINNNNNSRTPCTHSVIRVDVCDATIITGGDTWLAAKKGNDSDI